MSKEPHWPLKDLQRLAPQLGGLHIARDDREAYFSTRDEAVRVARRIIAKLTVKDFSKTVKLTWDVADVYGVRFNGIGWYFKVCIVREDDGPEGKQVGVISIKPLTGPLMTNGGKVEP